MNNKLDLGQYKEIIFCDFEFSAPRGEIPSVVCMVAKELRSGKVHRCWTDELNQCRRAPFSVGEDVLFVAYFVPAELSCFLALGWEFPKNILDLYVEFRMLANGFAKPKHGLGLVGALLHFNLSSISSEYKEDMRLLAQQASWTNKEKAELMAYCEEDVDALIRLLPAIDGATEGVMKQALFRGRYMAAVACMENVGIPIDIETLDSFRENRDKLKEVLIESLDKPHRNLFDGTTFKIVRFCDYIVEQGYRWPVTPSGKPKLDDTTFRDMALIHPELEKLRGVRDFLSKLKLDDISIGSDSRNRCSLSPFRAKTSRNQPSNSRFIFGPSSWIRSLIKPEEGYGLAYIDYAQQEIGIAAALSGDVALSQAYLSGDPYLEFAKMAGAVPASATRESHKKEREVFKQLMLATNYSMGSESIARRLGTSVGEAKDLLKQHKNTFSEFWKWSDSVIDYAMFHGCIYTRLGWCMKVDDSTRPTTLRNFPMQGNGADILRMACCLCTEAGIRVCAPVHDALLIEAPLGELEEVVNRACNYMTLASRAVLDGFPLETDYKIIRYPKRYVDGRGVELWDTVMDYLSIHGDLGHSACGETANGTEGSFQLSTHH